MRLHSKRANRVAYLWWNASNSTIEIPLLIENGWTTTDNIDWIEEAFPTEVEELVTRDEDNENDNGSDVESSDDEDYDDVF